MFKLLLICCSLTCVKILSENLKHSTGFHTVQPCGDYDITLLWHFINSKTYLWAHHLKGQPFELAARFAWWQAEVGTSASWPLALKTGSRMPNLWWGRSCSWCERWSIPARCNLAHLYAQLEFCKQTPRKGPDLLCFLNHPGWEALGMGRLTSHLVNAAMLRFSLEYERVVSVQL